MSIDNDGGEIDVVIVGHAYSDNDIITKLVCVDVHRHGVQWDVI